MVFFFWHLMLQRLMFDSHQILAKLGNNKFRVIFFLSL